jgi:hypothetical protein
VAAVIAGVLALVTAGMLVWFALTNVILVIELPGSLTSGVMVNVVGGLVYAGLLMVAAGLTFARFVFGAWTLCGLCAFHAVATFALAPLVWGTPFSDQLRFVFGFGDSDDTAAGLALIFSVLTVITAAIAGSVKSYGPPAATPPRP